MPINARARPIGGRNDFTLRVQVLALSVSGHHEKAIRKGLLQWHGDCISTSGNSLLRRSLCQGRHSARVFSCSTPGRSEGSPQQGLPLPFAPEGGGGWEGREAQPMAALVGGLDSLRAIFAHRSHGTSTLKT
jgi:hypothetical protein